MGIISPKFPQLGSVHIRLLLHVFSISLIFLPSSVFSFISHCKNSYLLIAFLISSECERCIAVLEESVALLLHCLETVDADLVVRKGYFSWEIQEGVKCACFLRRIYEEVDKCCFKCSV